MMVDTTDRTLGHHQEAFHRDSAVLLLQALHDCVR